MFIAKKHRKMPAQKKITGKKDMPVVRHSCLWNYILINKPQVTLKILRQECLITKKFTYPHPPSEIHRTPMVNAVLPFMFPVLPPMSLCSLWQK